MRWSFEVGVLLNANSRNKTENFLNIFTETCISIEFIDYNSNNPKKIASTSKDIETISIKREDQKLLVLSLLLLFRLHVQ